jgi:hypothetical protein
MPDAVATRDTVARAFGRPGPGPVSRDVPRKSPEWVKDALDVLLAAGLLWVLALLVAS